MNQSSNRSSSTERPCGLTALLPLGMSCRGRAEAFARSLQSRLRTLGTQPNESQPECSPENTWLNSNTYTQALSNVTNHQPVSSGNELHEAADAYFDLDIPGSPVDESEYAHLITSTTTTSQEDASNSGYVCASSITTVDNNTAIEQSDSSSDEPFFDPEYFDNEQRSQSVSIDYYDCDEVNRDVNDKIAHHEVMHNGHDDSNTTISQSLLPQSEVNTSNIVVNHESDYTNSCSMSQPSSYVIRPIEEPITCVKNEHQSNHVAITLQHANSISINDSIAEVQQIPKYEANTPKSTLTVESFVNGHSSEEDEEPVPRPERFRRSSSLKTGKTPPGTPGRKKIVRFADVLGLDLADVRTFLDEIPKVPKSAFDELTIAPEPPISLGQRLDKIIVPLFQQPGVSPNFLDVVQLQNVALETAAVTDPICLTITGLVRVRNLDFHKSVHVRYSLDSWQSYSDLQAEYVPNSCDGFSDKFAFTVFGNSMEVGQRIEIALRFSCKGQQFWDNNHGVNYCFQCMPATTPQLQTSTTQPNDNHAVHLHDEWCGTSFY